jgi:acetyl-CoA carboxylase, biotin carboxylase subunit
MIAKLICVGKDRDEAVRRLQSALHEFHVEGIATNIPFLRRLAAHPVYVAGDVHTGFVPRYMMEGGA